MGALEAGQYLKALLTENPACRARWQPHVFRGTKALDEPAVCRVLAQYMWDEGLRSERETDLPRKLKDLVNRALEGRVLTRQTLQWFIEAFGISDTEAERLVTLLDGPRPDRAVRGNWTSPALSVQRPYRTISLLEHHVIGAEGKPVQHETVQVIEALMDGHSQHQFIFDTPHVTIDVLSGGKLDGGVKPLDDGLYAAEIVFPRPLCTGDTTTLRYVARFEYQDRPVQEFRRGAQYRIDNISLNLMFHPSMPPAEVWFAIWPLRSPQPTTRHRIELGPDLAVHRYLSLVEQAIAGFTWTFPGQDSEPPGGPDGLAGQQQGTERGR